MLFHVFQCGATSSRCLISSPCHEINSRSVKPTKICRERISKMAKLT